MLTKNIKKFIIGATLLCSTWSVMGGFDKPTPTLERKDIVGVVEHQEVDLDIYAKENVPKRLHWLLEGLNIEVVHGQLENYYDDLEIDEGEDILGFYRHDGSAIVLESDDQDYLFTLKHELGHAIDIYVENGESKFMYSNSNYFLEIMQEEGLKLFGDEASYYLSSPQEYFAQCYALYLDSSYKEELKEFAPRTYSYMKDIVWRE